MDTVRSEYSEGSLCSSRLDDGSATGRASLSYSLSNSHTSRLSIDSVSTRSDFLSSFERKFRERKAEKHKKSEKAKREQAKAERQEIFSADARRKAQREAERQARRKEMETWLTDPNELRRIERRSQKRSRDRMRTLKEWYVPATSGPQGEVQPVFIAAMEQSNQEQNSRKKVVKPLLSKEAATIKDEEDREALEAVLNRQLTAFTTKLEYLEQFADPSTLVRAKTRAGPRRRRRIAGEDVHLTPLGPTRSNLRAAKSIANLPAQCVMKDEHKLTTSTSLQTLRSISRVQVDNEFSEDALNDAEIEEYLLQHRKVTKQVYAAIKLQAVWRMYLCRRKYLPWRQRRTRRRRAIFEIWVMTYKVGYRAQRSLLRKYFTAWRIDVVEALQLREMELRLFQQAATQTELPRMVINLVFTSDWEDERAKRLAAKAAEAAKKKSIAPSSKAAFLNAFLSAAFGNVESVSDKGRSRVHQLRAQHVAAREEVRKKVVQHVFRLWKRVHEANKRVGLNAQLCLKRAVRMAFGTRQRWPAETLLSVFEIWARWASFSRCKRLGLPLPHFTQSNPHWDIWLHNYQERQVRCVKAAAKAPGARLRRYFLRLHAFARCAIRKRHVLMVACQHYDQILSLKALLEWREAIADSAAEKKLVRGFLLRMHRYTCAKRKLRPLKETLRKRRREWLASRAMRGWTKVQLHACFKRELNLSKLENSQAWRSRLHRTLNIWRDERASLRLWRTFEAWTHFVRKRKLFLTLRLLCARQERRNLLFGVFNAWKSAKWDRVDGFLEDSLRLDAWDAYRELSVFFPMMFFGNFSDAGSIFGGLPSYIYGESGVLQNLKRDKQDLILATSGDAVRHFHGVLVRDSVMEVRNAILQTRHLVNAVDDASGNTALHVAAQIEEPERRLEILSLLLSEGAATLKRVNRHGLSPLQLAPDPDTRLLLNEGIFAFYSQNILSRDVNTEGSKSNCRLLWCMTTLMTREWETGLRIPADVKIGHWYSTLHEELWLRQKHIRFTPDSTFAPAVTRSRGFLNALKTRLCLSHYDFLSVSQPRKPIKYSKEFRYQEWEERAKARNAKAAETGEYEAYARYLLATTLDTETCEQELIPSFVGLLFSLEFSIDDILSQAYRLEEECTTAESQLWELYQRIQRAEKTWCALFSQDKITENSRTRNDVGMLRLISDDADADLFFKKEIFLLEFEQFNAKERNIGEDGMDIQQEALALELDSLMIRTKRKLRKAEKKVKRVQDQIDSNERAHREALFATVRRVEEVCKTRTALEHSRLRMALAMIKQSEAKSVVVRLEYAKQVLQSGERPESSTPDAVVSTALADLPVNERKTFLKQEMTRYSRMFQSRAILEENAAAVKLQNENNENFVPKKLPEPLRLLQKEAVNKLHTLFVLNLLRSCCCWLAENMIATEAENEEESIEDSESEESDDGYSLAGEEANKTGRKSGRLQSIAAVFAEGIPRRRSSIINTRRVIETYHQGSSSNNLLDPDSETMNTTYANSSMLLFEEERRVSEQAERERLSTKKGEVVAAFAERNPVTGQFEFPPDHIVRIKAIPATEAAAVVKTNEFRRNRKKEELHRAMMHRRLKHEGDDDSDSEDGDCVSQADLLPVIHDTNFHFGNFVTGDRVWLNRSSNFTVVNKDSPDVAGIEAMWKRGGVKVADGSSIKEVLEKAHRLSSAREKLRPGSRRQGVTMQEVSELLQPLQDAPEVQPASIREAKLPDKSSPVNVQQMTKRQRSVVRSLGRSSSMSKILPGFKTSSSPTSTDSVIEVKKEITPNPENQVVPAIQINTRSRQNSSNSLRSGRISTREETSPDTTGKLEVLDHEMEVPVREEVKNTLETNLDDIPHDKIHMEVHEQEESDKLEVGVVIQSPVVEISTSRTSESSGERFNGSKLTDSLLTHEVGENFTIHGESVASSVNPLIKWEESAGLEAFPLAVTPSQQPKSAGVGDQRNSINLEKGELVSRVSSLRVLKTPSEMDNQIATRFVLDDTISNENLLEMPADNTNEVFALQGKSLVMAKKHRRALSKINSTGSITVVKTSKAPFKDVKEFEDTLTTDNLEKDSPGNAPLVRPISVMIVTKPVKREVEVPEVVEKEHFTSIPDSFPLKKAQLSPPKPFVKLDGAMDVEEEDNIASILQLEGMRLNTVTPKIVVVAYKLDGLKKMEQTASPRHEATRSSLVSTRKTRLEERMSSSTSSLSLQGARMTVPKTGDVKNINKLLERTGFEDMAPLSKTEKEKLWREFAAEPLSTSVQDAYTILYPQMYESTSAEAQSHQNPHAVPVNRKKSSISIESTSLSHSSLRVGSTRESLEKTLELNRKFWSAVEGYRAIGTSSLVPLDAATIVQRRQDKAQVISDQFFCEHRDKGGNGESRGLPLPWLDMYSKEVADVEKQLVQAPKGLFDELQRTAVVQISTILAKRQTDQEKY